MKWLRAWTNDICMKCRRHDEPAKGGADAFQLLFRFFNLGSFTCDNDLIGAIDICDANRTIPLIQICLDLITSRPYCRHGTGNGSRLVHQFTPPTGNIQQTGGCFQRPGCIKRSHFTITVPGYRIRLEFQGLQQIQHGPADTADGGLRPLGECQPLGLFIPRRV